MPARSHSARKWSWLSIGIWMIVEWSRFDWTCNRTSTDWKKPSKSLCSTLRSTASFIPLDLAYFWASRVKPTHVITNPSLTFISSSTDRKLRKTSRPTFSPDISKSLHSMRTRRRPLSASIETSIWCAIVELPRSFRSWMTTLRSSRVLKTNAASRS